MNDQTSQGTLSSAAQAERVKVRLQALFKQIDGYIKEGNFEKARVVLAEARLLDPANPFIIAFSDRIGLFEQKKQSGTALPPVQPPPPASKQQISEYYSQQMKEVEERFKAAQAELMSREREALARRESKLREEYRQQLEKISRQSIAAPVDIRTLQLREAERQRLQDELTRKLEGQLDREREIFSAQYSHEHAKLQQMFLADQRRLIDEQRLEMTEQIQAIRRREAEEFDRRRQETFRELEGEFNRKLEEAIAAGRAPAPELPPPEPVPPAVSPEQQKKIRQELREEMEQAFLTRIEQMVAAYNKKMDLLGFVMPQSKEEAVALYRRKLKECYADGTPSLQQAEQIMEFKELLELTFDEHMELEASVRMELYVEHVERLLRTPGFELRSSKALDDLKGTFSISQEEAAHLEPYFLSSLERAAVRGRILLADDDPNIRMSLDAVLSANGYLIIACESVPSAMEALRKEPVDLIVSDLKFGPEEPDGFQFFSLVQKEPLLRKIPFLLLSAMTDNVYIRTGVQLGVDDYLTKPIDPDFLMAVVEGKLKRFRRVVQ